MVSFNEISNKQVLIIDDMEGMRAQLRTSLSSCGFAKLHVVSNIRDALAKIAENPCDIILCDYTLGNSTNGQQFLEYLRTNDVIRRNTIFIMITAEQSYDMVVAASECAPDDYLLKPFTPEQLLVRLNKLMAKQAYFVQIDKASDQKNWEKVIAECDKLLATKDPYFVDVCKIKGSALLKNKQPEQAIEFYQKVLNIRPLSWAKLGLARAFHMQENQAEAEKITREVLAENPKFMAAYDFLSQLLTESDDETGALEILQKARTISPGTMSRIRKLGTLALQTKQPALAEDLMKKTLQQHKFSPVKQAGDYVILSKSLISQSKNSEAIAVVDDARKSFSDKNSKALLNITESSAWHASGDAAKAENILDKTIEETGDLASLPLDVVMDMAEACFKQGKEEHAKLLLTHVVQNNEDSSVKKRVRATMVAAGRDEEEAAKFITDSEQEIVKLNNEGVQQAQAGKLKEAIELLTKASARLPNNVQILSNVAMVMALNVSRNGPDDASLAACLRYRQQLIQKSPHHPKLERIDQLLKSLKK